MMRTSQEPAENAAVEMKNIIFEHLYHKPPVDAEALFQQLLEWRELIRPYVGDAVGFVHQALKEGKTVLLEGQLGSMKDPGPGHLPHDHLLPHSGRLWRRGRLRPPHRLWRT